MITALYLTLERGRWGSTKVTKISRRCPRLAKPTEQALLKLNIDLPDSRDVFRPREIAVQIRPEHLALPAATVTPAKPQAT